MSMSIALMLAALLALQPAPAQPDEGPESMAARYFAPLENTEAERVISEDRLRRAGPITLARSIGTVEDALADCKSMRLQMETLIGDDFGSYSVHPNWVDGYKSCLQVRFDEIQEIGTAIQARQQAMLNGQDAENAVRAADAMARLRVLQMNVRRDIEAEVEAQKGFIQYYNTGERGAGTGH